MQNNRGQRGPSIVLETFPTVGGQVPCMWLLNMVYHIQRERLPPHMSFELEEGGVRKGPLFFKFEFHKAITVTFLGSSLGQGEKYEHRGVEKWA